MYKVYIDIDGVLLERGQKIPEGAIGLIQFLVLQFDCYWLTTHCRAGENKTIEYLKPFYDEKTIELLKKIKPTNWDTLKTEAIDFSSNFYWLEDYPFNSEIKILEQHNKLNSLVKVNLNDHLELKRVQEVLTVK
mgnify:CR=1 FL=1